MKFVFGIEKEYDEDDSGIVIVNKEFWKENGHVDDSFTEEERDFLEPIIEKCGLYEYMEASYEMSKSLEETKAMLIAEGLEYEEELTEFLNDH